MGILTHNENTDFIPYIKDSYNVEVGVSHGDLYWDALGKYDGATIGPHIAQEIGDARMYDNDHMREQVKIVAKIMLGLYFTRKHSNGLYKKFTFEWKSIDYGYICQVRDDLRNSHMKIILKQKNYGFIQKATHKVSIMVKRFCRVTS